MLIFDKDPENPSLRQLINPFFRKRRATSEGLLNRLETNYSNRPIWWPETKEPFSPEGIQQWRDKHQQETETLRQGFWNLVNSLSRDWGRLTQV